MTHAQMSPTERWTRRLYLPAYTIANAAKYARTSPQTVAYWHYGPKDPIQRPGRRPTRPTLPGKEKGLPLSYMQLVEVAFVAAFRRLGMSLKSIRETHSYAAQTFGQEFPFAWLPFKSMGTSLILEMADVVSKAEADKIVIADQWGQVAWRELAADRFMEFEYERNLALKWRIGGELSKVIIDPRVSYGAPTVAGVPTWAIKGRRLAGETIEDITDDFAVEEDDVKQALEFEGVAA